ncbi:acyl-CoA dehydrogenase family protein [Rhodococcus globerulus]|uniref:Acyl-CoA dehydrogenase family protein n=1 Tax=Rhodococcus globerulus TaxID=33008 RepID=A0ABU4C3B9_RHOGO|nr:acyl-CoA dehydrogenase family protein [Rhodococcus globerulus]MDV6270997.1 acyl-CoA dehydrogenase family protein [Rhodococcus globerulus]
MTVSERGGNSADALSELARALEIVAENASKYDVSGEFPHDSIRTLTPTGVLAYAVPRVYGGAEKSLEELVAATELVGAADPAVGLLVLWNFTNHFALRRPDNPWPERIREEILRSAVTDGALINGLTVERDLGSLGRGGSPATRATPAPGGGWFITGEKAYGTGISGLSWIPVVATTVEDQPRLGVFLVRPSTPDWEILETWNHLGLRASDTQSVRFTDAYVPADDVLELVEAGPNRIVNIAMLVAPVLLAANYNGVSVSIRNWLVEYLHHRVPTNLGAPLSTVPRIIDRVGEIESLLLTSESLTKQAARNIDDGIEHDPSLGQLAKHVATTTALRISEIALDLTGNPGLARENPLERHHRNAIVGRVHFPQSDFIITSLGRRTLQRDKAVAQ